MTKFSYKNNRKKPRYFSLASYVIFGLMAIWLLSSIYLGKSPFALLKSGVESVGNATSSKSKEDLIKEIAQKDSLIAVLQFKLRKGDVTGLKRAIVKVSTNTLNMRDKASLSSDIVLQIPAESEVSIMFYDTESYFLEGKQGKWCKIKYAGQEGWVWGNFLLEIE